jgi:DNA replication protein DnaC
MTTPLRSEQCAPTCTICGDTGFVFVLGESRRVTRCQCRGNEVRLRSILPPLLQGARLSDCPQPLVDIAERWLAQPTSGILLTGSPGRGKTWIAAGIVRALVGAGKKVLFKCAEDFYLELRAGFDNPDSREVLILSQFSDVEFLVLDDIGAGSLSDYERRSTLHVLDRRMDYLRPTIVTSNLTLEGIAEKLDERIASRLSGFTRIVMTGRDRRVNK